MPAVVGRVVRCSRRAGAVCLLAVVAIWPAAAAEPAPVGEHELKAAFLPKFPLFVQWPSGAFKAPGDPLVIGILGDASFAGHAEHAVAGKVIGGRALSVQVCRDAAEARRCHIVFILGDDPKATEETLRDLAGSSVLTISDAPNFASQGGMVNLVTANKRVRLEVNLEAIQRAELRMDPQLLQMAKAVKTSARKTKP